MSTGTRVGVDTGGTFTDLVARPDDGRFVVAKTLSTPRTPSLSTSQALDKAEIGENGAVAILTHGTTIATNALVERRGAVVGLLTTEGFRDLLQIQRGGRPKSFNLTWRKSEHLVPRYLRAEVAERVNSEGEIATPLDEAGVLTAIEHLLAEGAQAIAVAFLFSYLNPVHERRARDVIAERYPDLLVSVSSEVFGQWREYERMSTCVIDAYLKSTVDAYANELEQLAADRSIGELLIMRSNGGAMTPAGARALPVSMVRSGPAGGVIASVFVGGLTGDANLLLGDMGGTSFDTCLIADARPAVTTQSDVEWGIPIAGAMVDVRSIGAGGGSIAWLDDAGILHVGPHSAGSDPGPACYGRGGRQATVTDANLVLGRLSADQPLGGDVALDVHAATDVISALAESMGKTVTETALGILQVADNGMAQALRLVSIDRGHDPRDFALVAFGGAGPLHASALARALSISRVLVPIFPGAFSAFGALIADTRFDYMRTVVVRVGGSNDRVRQAFAELDLQARSDLERENATGEASLRRAIDMRYLGQNWELEVPLDGEPTDDALRQAAERFHDVHSERFGWSLATGALEFVNCKLTAEVPRPRPEVPQIAAGELPQPIERRNVTFDPPDGVLETPVYWRDALGAENRIDGPAIVAETNCTTLLAPGDSLEVDAYGNLIVSVGKP